MENPIVKENINEELIIILSKFSYLEYQLRNKKIAVLLGDFDPFFNKL
jgi:hypothetical protein